MTTTLHGLDATLWGAGAWVAIGCALALVLASRGAPEATALVAIVAWPFLLPLLSTPATPPDHRGPCGSRIDRAIEGVLQALQDADAATDGAVSDLHGVRDALHAADRRIGRADRMLAETEDVTDVATAEQQRLRQARDAARDDLDGVLSGLVQLRLQVGRLALAGDTAPVGRQLAELRARVGALGELAQLDSDPRHTLSAGR